MNDAVNEVLTQNTIAEAIFTHLHSQSGGIIVGVSNEHPEIDIQVISAGIVQGIMSEVIALIGANALIHPSKLSPLVPLAQDMVILVENELKRRAGE